MKVENSPDPPPIIADGIQDIVEQKKREELLRIQQDMGIALGAAKDFADGLAICFEAALRVSEMDSGGIYIVNEGTGALELQYHCGLSPRFVASAACYPTGSPSFQVAIDGKPVYMHYVQMPVPVLSERDQEGLRAIAVIPFRHDGHVIGSLNLASHTVDEMPAQAKILLEIIASQIGSEVGRLSALTALHASEARYRSIVENMNDEMLIIDFAGNILDVNDNACQVLGYTRAELIGLNLSAIDSASDASHFQRRVAHLIEKGSLIFDGEHRRKEGSLVAVNVSARIVSREKQGIIQCFVRDISAIRKMEIELARKQKLEALGILAGGIAHDFNNLLGGVFGFMDLARMSMQPGDPAINYLDEALAGFEQAKNLSQQLLTFAKGGSPVKRTVRVADIIRGCSTLALSGSNIKVIAEIPESVSAVEADQHQLAQVFSNLLINARQAMPNGGTITVTADNRTYDGAGTIPLSAGAYVAVAIRDEGVGIPEKIIDRIFDPFFSTKQQGSGLGLSICFSIVKRHGGHIEVSSIAGIGSVFTVWLPATAQTQLKMAGAPDLPSFKGTGRILVMDDEPAIRAMASAILRSAGYDVVAVANGESAVETYRSALEAQSPFDLQILDLTVPGGMGGEKTMAELQKINPDVIAIVSSGYADSSLLADFEGHGFAAMIPKPYMVNELLAVVTKALGKSAGHRE
jgi:two-component system cell cycle sensor histidine kinase/response regulator CckA